ncbi:Type I phosphodiesterase / nucleotide pyrophosphatase [Actinokineospora alba]|uniref:Type I phosphodiesterase / nucleotide pyrophosphatase n=1 Tax=Actinokineospora alba TaxID=504798 RepID=A0A1H0F9D7_9PSEU|nr:nucleotide pyrophosphatase/phosphodiesterase family protein [Actinokineospora alba]TDP69392.1 type I phosphodiesterase/nucleotide pyrophosphatase [Actinokineospora alba]SDI17677.1 Type I phosphodiesterase / nucleotide pyrophosphatase [Actinokineospora alba]SDN91210.1 Type I phosphodiesterase / nucleotide pyrophosphatase [Actinokineospora alba]
MTNPHTLADVLPSVASSFGVDGPNPLGLAPNRDVVVLLIDGLGAESLARHRDAAPTLAAHVRTTLAAGFPATTSTSLTSLAVGAPCATHGIIGYSFAMPGADGPRLFNSLRWRLDTATGDDAREHYPPETVQQRPSRLQDLAAHGVAVHYVVPAYQRNSGLTRAAFRAAGTVHPAACLDEVRAGILTVADHPGAGSRFAYAYFPDLDTAGHLHGPESPQWLEVLRAVDACVADLVADLPATCTLLVTGDHGMIRADTAVDLDTLTRLHRDVRLIGGEARVRHVYLDRPDALPAVLAAWVDELSTHARVVSREQALDERWFGRTPPASAIADRIGDVIAVAEGNSVLLRPGSEPIESSLLGHHGAWSADEQLVPLIELRQD